MPHERWPEGPNGPLEAIAQINLGELPFRPPSLADLSLITVFVDWNSEGYVPPRGQPFSVNGVDWCLRAYRTLDGLVPLVRPIKPRVERAAIRWELHAADYPSRDDIDGADDEAVEAAGVDWWTHFECEDGFKVGGWPALIQGEIFWGPFKVHPSSPAYQFQIGSEGELDGMHFVDQGTCYFGRGELGHEHEWAYECYFY